MRWKLRFGLRTLLLATALLGVALAWLGSTLHSARLQQEAVAHLQDRGAWFFYDFEGESGVPRSLLDWFGVDVFHSVTVVGVRSPHHAAVLTDRDIPTIARLQGLRVVKLRLCEITDAAVAQLASLNHLEDLDLMQTPVTDKGLEQLRRAKNLRRLDLTCCDVTDEGLAHLRRLKNLEELILSGTLVSGSGLRRLAGLPRLRYLRLEAPQPYCNPGVRVNDQTVRVLTQLTQLQALDLDYTAITDATLARLQRMKNLKQLSVIGTEVSQQGIDALKAANPNLEIIVERPVLPGISGPGHP